ncbi:hypothetical protein D3C85_1089410 [compost metagenome]
MVTTHAGLLVGQVGVAVAARMETLLLGDRDAEVLVGDPAQGLFAVLEDVVLGRFHRPLAQRRGGLGFAMGRTHEVPVVEQALLRIGRVRHRTQDLVRVGGHGERHVGEQGVVVVVGQLVVVEVGVLAVAARLAQLALLLLQRDAHLTGTTFEVVGIQFPGAHHGIQRRLHLLRLAVAGRQGTLHQHPAVAVAEDLEGGVLIVIVDEGTQLLVQALHMVGLVEVVLDDLPVALHFAGQVHDPHHLVHLVGFELVSDDA